MRVCFVTEGQADAFKVEESDNAEVIVFSFNGIKELNYKKELKGETEELVKLGRLSGKTKSIVICGCVSDNYGTKKLSAIIADKGKIVGIADMTGISPTDEYASGGGFKIISTSIGKIGVLVGNDLFSPQAVKSMSLCEADLIVNVYKTVDDYKPGVVMRSYSVLYGVPICVCAQNFSMASCKGETLFSSPEGVHVHDIPTKKSYREILSKQRGEAYE